MNNGSRLQFFWRDLRIILRAVWLNLALFLLLLTCTSLLLDLSGAYAGAAWIDRWVDAYHMAVGERVVSEGAGWLPDLLTVVLPLLTLVILGEGVLRVFSVFMTRKENREEWNKMVAKTFHRHMIVCGVGELGRALVRHLVQQNPQVRLVLVDPRPGVMEELGLKDPNLVHLQADMTNMDALEQANCRQALYVFMTSGDDAVNLEAAYKAVELNPRAEIWVRLYRSKLAALLDTDRKGNIHFFCPYQAAAEQLAGMVKNQ